MTRVRYEDLLEAFEFLRFDTFTENDAFVSLDTGAVYWVSGDESASDPLPDDFETSDRYLAVPRAHDLALGQVLVFRFVEQSLPQDYDAVRGIFRKRGAYGRFKDLLERRGRLDDWYQFEARAVKTALMEWCAEHDIELVDGQGEKM